MATDRNYWRSLKNRLRGRLVLPNDGALYNEARSVFNARIDQHPSAIAYCANHEDVVACVRFCEANGLKAVCRCGGHGALGFSTRSDQLVIDMTALQTIGVDLRRKTVKVGGGAFWGQVDLATYPRGYAAPGGGCPQVGVGGLAQGGGFGPLSRSRGLTIDNLIEAEVVTSRQGRLTKVSATEEPDLFWALRGGGGGNFGAVTSFTFGLQPIDHPLTAGSLMYCWNNDTRRMLQFYRDWMRSDGCPRLTLLPIIGFDNQANPFSLLSVLYDGDWVEGYKYLDKIFNEFRAPTAAKTSPGLGPMTLPAFTATNSTSAWPGQSQYWKSGFLANDFPDAAIDTIMAWFNVAPKPAQATRAASRLACRAAGDAPRAPDLSFGFIESLGGRIRDKRPEETAFYWRDNLFSFTFVGVCKESDTGLSHELQVWADNFRKAMAGFLTGAVYVNYMQEGLGDWKCAYYCGNVERLCAIKKKYDPLHMFSFPQDLSQP
jgi:FAD/FMN-containing dehydrogenase